VSVRGVRILLVSNLYPPLHVGGYEQRCAVVARWLAREHDVTVLTSRRRRRSLETQSDVLRKLPLLPEDWRGTLCAPFASLYAALFMRRLLRRLRPDLVFVWNASQIPRAALYAAAEQGPAMAFSVADPWFAAFVRGDQFLRYLVRPSRERSSPARERALPSGDRAVSSRERALPSGDRAVSSRERALPSHERAVQCAWAWVARLVNRLPGLRIDPTAVHTAAIVWNSQALRGMAPAPDNIVPVLERVIHPATDHEQLLKSVEHVPAPSPTIAYVGRIENQKAPDVAVRAVALLRESHGIDARLVIVGSGDVAMVRDLQLLAAALGLGDRVQLLGQVSPSEVAKVLAGADALVVPSRWQEPFGLVCLEGALARVPIVASVSGGMPEMLESEREALFFPIDDVGACAAALARTLTDEVGTRQRVRAAFERAASYSMQRHNAAYEAFVSDAVQAAQRAVESLQPRLS
jgi:glycosyltransferase involved in cell wall biosynthesis